jgi:hypothetical protein
VFPGGIDADTVAQSLLTLIGERLRPAPRDLS